MSRPPSGRLVGTAAVATIVLALTGCTSATPTRTLPTVVPVRSTPSAVASAVPSSAAPSPSATPTTVTPSSAAAGFDRTRHSVDDPSSIWVIVDKQRPISPRGWVPPDLVVPAVAHTNVPQLRAGAAAALERMFRAAKADGIGLVSLSAYRSEAVQRSVFDRNVATLGRARTLLLTAKPGYSEHQTGLADDLGDGTSCDLQVCFEAHPAARWLTANAWRFGWVQRYPEGYTRITGIQVEPWHFRYVGRPLAAELRRTGTKTLEQFFHLPPSPDY